MKPLENKIALVTGAARGIGQSIALQLAADGADLALCDVKAEWLDDTASKVKALGRRAEVYAMDVANGAAVGEAVARVAADFGRIDVLVNNAGITQRRGVMDVTAQDYDLVTGVVLRGTLHMSQAVIPHMRSRGSGAIVCMSSMSAQQGGGVFGGTHYCAAKAGVIGMAKAMARELGPDGIRVNSVAPGLILTDFSRGANSDEAKHEMARAFPLRRIGRPVDIAGACLYLASDLSAFTTGTTLDVNGGAHIR